MPRSNADRCTDYVKRCQDPNTGGFSYQAGFRGGAGFARTAAGVVALNSAGVYHVEGSRPGSESVRRGLDYLMRFLPGSAAAGASISANDVHSHYHYGHYYAVQAMWTAGGNYWRRWYPAIRARNAAKPPGRPSWQQGMWCPNYCTAMSLIVLQVPNNYLPILQR